MPSIEVIEVLNLIMMSIALVSFSVVSIRVKSLLKYIPAFITLWIALLSTNVEALVNPDMFNFMEHSFIMITGILMTLAVFYDFFNAFLRNKIKPEGRITK